MENLAKVTAKIENTLANQNTVITFNEFYEIIWIYIKVFTYKYEKEEINLVNLLREFLSKFEVNSREFFNRIHMKKQIQSIISIKLNLLSRSKTILAENRTNEFYHFIDSVLAVLTIIHQSTSPSTFIIEDKNIIKALFSFSNDLVIFSLSLPLSFFLHSSFFSLSAFFSLFFSFLHYIQREFSNNQCCIAHWEVV